MSTRAQLLAAHRLKLDRLWHKRYPQGKFSLQTFVGGVGLYWEPRRATSHSRPYGIGVELTLSSETVKSVDYLGTRMGNAKGRTKGYSTLSDLKRAALRVGVPADVVEWFEKLYDERSW